MGQAEGLDLPIFIILGGVLGMLLLAVAVIAFFLVYQKRLFRQQEELQQLEAAYQKELLQHTIEAQEKERQRIAADLHDSIGSMLSATRMYIHQLNGDLSTEHREHLKRETNTLIDSTITQIRTISHDLFPPQLEHLGLFPAIQTFAQRLQATNTLAVECQLPETSDLSPHQELSLYRILQELLQNTLKHAGATQVQIIFKKHPIFKMIYRDNGQGFNASAVRQLPPGQGLKNIESRSFALGALFEFKAEQGTGMSFELSLPDKKQAPLPS